MEINDFAVNVAKAALWIAQVQMMRRTEKIVREELDFFLFTPKEKEAFIAEEPMAENFFYEWCGADELIKGHRRFFLWLAKCPPSKLREMPLCKERIERVREYRKKSPDPGTRELADTPTEFHVSRIPQTSFVVIPEVTSENRNYIPMDFVDMNEAKKKLFSNLVKLMPGATLYHFGVLMSEVHMIWTKAICGYKDFRPRYSTNIVFNNFPWPEPSEKQKEAIEASANAILEARKLYGDSSLADLYDIDAMPNNLRKAHAKNDKAVIAAYGFEGMNEEEIIKALLQQYKNLIKRK